jgi:hypothetical protein
MQVQASETFDTTESLKHVLTSLVDAVRYSEHATEIDQKAIDADEAGKANINKLDEFVKETGKSLKKLLNGMDHDYSLDTSKQISTFVSNAAEQGKVRIADAVNKKIADLRILAESERTKAKNSLEAFIAASPMPLFDKVVTVSLAEGGYEAKAKYNCEGSIEYEFWLEAKNNKLFRQPFTFTSTRKELRIPVALGKGWMKKDPVPTLERLDKYVLTSAEVSPGTFLANFTSPDTGATIKTVYSKRNEDAFVALEYSDKTGRIDVTSDPNLHRHLDTVGLKAALEELLSGLNELEKHKLKLTRLVSDEEDILAQTDYADFMMKVLNIVSPRVKDILVLDATGTPTDGAQQRLGPDLDLNMIKERLRLLGGRARPAAELLGIQRLVQT